MAVPEHIQAVAASPDLMVGTFGQLACGFKNN